MSLSANTIVGICIIAAIFACVILASVIKLCTKEAGLENTENLYKPYDPHQIERLHEVRRLGNMMAWERGRWAKLELIKQGRRMTVGYDDAMESLSTLEGQNGYDMAHNQYHPQDQQHQYLHPNDPRAYRDSHMTQMTNPYADPNRRSKMLKARRVQHAADESEEEVDMEADLHLPGLPGYAMRSQEGMRRSPGSSDDSKGKGRKRQGRNAAESHAYLGTVIQKKSSGLNEQVPQHQPQPLRAYQAPVVRDLTPEPSPTAATGLIHPTSAHFEDIDLNDTTISQLRNDGRAIEYDSDDVKSDTTVKPTSTSPVSPIPQAQAQVHYEEDSSALQNPIGTAIPLPPPALRPVTPSRHEAVRYDAVVNQNQRQQRSYRPHYSKPTPPTPRRREEVIELNQMKQESAGRGPIIMINDDGSDPVNDFSVSGNNPDLTTKDLPTTVHDAHDQSEDVEALVNLSNEAGAGDVRDVSSFEPTEDGKIGGRFWNGNVRVVE